MTRRSGTEAYEVKGTDLKQDSEVRCCLQSSTRSFREVRRWCGKALGLLSAPLTPDLGIQNGAVGYLRRNTVAFVD